MKADEFHKIMKIPLEKAGEADIEFWIGDTELELDRIGQFNVVPDITVEFKEIKEESQCDHYFSEYVNSANLVRSVGVDYKCKYCPECGTKLEGEKE